MSTPASNIPGRHGFNWKVVGLVLAILIIVALGFIGAMLYQQNQALDDTAPKTRFDYGTGGSSTQEDSRDDLQKMGAGDIPVPIPED